jgi:ribosomal protein S18 acetylase RimI-like enzyme
MVGVRELAESDWELLRDVRLAALSEAPYAFASTYAREAGFTEEQWRGRILSRGATFFGFLPDAGEPAGVSGVYIADGVADLVSMWVRPSARGRGVGESLIEAAADWAKARDYDTLFLWVTESNAAARRLYERCGFTATGERQPLPSDPALSEIQLSRPL